MNKKILDVINTTAGQLIFALLSGCGYFMILLKFIIQLSNGSGILAFFFAPVIICGAAIIIIRLIKQARAEDNNSAIVRLVWLHILLIIIGIVFLLALVMN